MNTRTVLNKAQKLVIKVGSALLMNSDSHDIKKGWIEALAQDIAALSAQGREVIIVSSGGVAFGRKALGISWDTRPIDIRLEQKQAASAVGQPRIFAAYEQALEALGLTGAQVLLTMLETENRRMHLNARETLQTLLDHNVVPIINENDTISTEELRFGDNDRLAARVAQMVDADCVVLLSTADGLFDKDPNRHPDARLIPLVEQITEEHLSMAGEALPGLSTGGMKSKLQAALASTRAGIPLIIAHGEEIHALRTLFEDENKPSTLFAASENRISARKRWIEGHVNAKGSFFVDEGAMEALKKGKSLLPVGVKRMEGTFKRGDPIRIKTLQGYDIGIGLSAYASGDAAKIIGKHSADIADILGFTGRAVLVHRDDMVLGS
ncbi:MAG: glutamate 5-kinase [Alphaproteobacteria bacterium]|nr:glutamate 5-kinase [Alphaproteobacteria bacterium]